MNRPNLILRSDGPPIQLVPSQPSRAHLLGVFANDLQQIQKIGVSSPISHLENDFLESFKVICDSELKRSSMEDQAVTRALSNLWQLFNLLAGQQMVLKLAIENFLNIKTKKLRDEMFGLCEVIVDREASNVSNQEMCTPNNMYQPLPRVSPRPKKGRGRGNGFSTRGRGIAAARNDKKLLMNNQSEERKNKATEPMYDSDDD